jgi:diguanylate cyclase (GGDEF)-like protein
MTKPSLYFKSKLSLQLLAKIIIVSGLITCINVAIQVYFDYETEKKYVDNEIDNILTAMVLPLRSALERGEANQVQKLLTTMTTFDNIGHVQIRTELTDTLALRAFSNIIENQNSFMKVTAKNKGEIGADSQVLFHAGSLKEGVVQTLSIKEKLLVSKEKENTADTFLWAFTNLDVVKEKVLENLYVIGVTQGIKTFVVSFFLLILFHYSVVKHLSELNKWMANFNPNLPNAQALLNTLHNSQAHSTRNELDELKGSVGKMGNEVLRYTTSLERLVEERTKELAEANRRLEKIAYTDSLTNVANRRSFFEKAEDEVNRARRLSYHLGLILLDLDHFKNINDTFGHDAGDVVLVKVAAALKNCLRGQDCLARVGGEEFAIALPGADEIAMRSLTKRLNDAVSSLDFDFMNRQAVTISMGYTVVDTNESVKAALKRADDYLYRAKACGRNCAITDEVLLKQIMS